MSRAKRIRIALGIFALLVGLASFSFGPAIASLSYMSGRVPTEQAHQQRIADMVYATKMLYIGGIIVSCLSAFYVFAEWASWFIGQSKRAIVNEIG